MCDRNVERMQHYHSIKPFDRAQINTYIKEFATNASPYFFPEWVENDGEKYKIFYAALSRLEQYTLVHDSFSFFVFMETVPEIVRTEAEITSEALMRMFIKDWVRT